MKSNYRIEYYKTEPMRICNKCNKECSTENNNKPCHLCEDWNGCGGDCTISKIFCKKCGWKE